MFYNKDLNFKNEDFNLYAQLCLGSSSKSMRLFNDMGADKIYVRKRMKEECESFKDYIVKYIEDNGEIVPVDFDVEYDDTNRMLKIKNSTIVALIMKIDNYSYFMNHHKALYPEY